MKEPRILAFELLAEWEEKKTYPNLALKKALRVLEDPRDRRFVTALFYGVIERKITLDHFVSKCCSRPLDSIHVKCLIALRMGIYQMFYMDVPPSAACNTTVELLKKLRLFKFTAFCNANLRACAERKEELLILKKADFSVRYSIDSSLVDLLLEQYGKERFVEMMESLQKNTEPQYLYHNPNKGDEKAFFALMQQEGIELSSTDLPGLFQAKQGFSVDESDAYRKGWFHVVGHHSAMAALMCPRDAKNVMDLCAAPGGKTFILASDAKRTVRAFDIHPHKIRNLKNDANRLGLHNVVFGLRDGAHYEEADCESADFVLCDVPCSGLGIMGKKPDIKYKRYDSAHFTDLQMKILKNGMQYLKNGKYLIYSTCTIDQRENHLLIQRFLEQYPQHKLQDERIFLPLDGNDGFYIALIQKG